MTDDQAERIERAVDAFALLSHETRMASIDVLWRAQEPLTYSEIADQAGISDTGNFNYHFGRLVGHYVRDHGETYTLTRAGRRAMTAVMAGDVTERPGFEPVTLDEACPFCESPIELRHEQDRLRVLCTSCPGTFEPGRETPHGDQNPHGTLTTFAFPPSGLRDRDPTTVLDVALSRLVSQYRSLIDGICPECAGPIERIVTRCQDHADGICEACGSRFAGEIRFQCRTCRLSRTGLLSLVCLTDTAVQRYFQCHGHDMTAPNWEATVAFFGASERVGDDPAYELTWELGETLTVQLDETGAILGRNRDRE